MNYDFLFKIYQHKNRGKFFQISTITLNMESYLDGFRESVKRDLFITYQPVPGQKLQQVKVKRHKTSFLLMGIFSFGYLSETELN